MISVSLRSVARCSPSLLRSTGKQNCLINTLVGVDVFHGPSLAYSMKSAMLPKLSRRNPSAVQRDGGLVVKNSSL